MSATLALRMRGLSSTYAAARRQLVRSSGRVQPFGTIRFLSRHERALAAVAAQLEAGEVEAPYALALFEGCQDRLDTYTATRRLGANNAAAAAHKGA